MKSMYVYGASDDLIEVEVEGGYHDEFYALSGRGDDAGYFDVKTPAGEFRVHAIYDGCWSFALGMTDEAVRPLIPEFTVEPGTGEPHPEYSMVLHIAIPDEFHIEPCQGWRD